ncbi:hypothetical protein LTR85_007175 [Meristemomyces frigidus]|nr:hypothetical protein LTR85_007175 [Meristemomyces frigidus]
MASESAGALIQPAAGISSHRPALQPLSPTNIAYDADDEGGRWMTTLNEDAPAAHKDSARAARSRRNLETRSTRSPIGSAQHISKPTTSPIYHRSPLSPDSLATTSENEGSIWIGHLCETPFEVDWPPPTTSPPGLSGSSLLSGGRSPSAQQLDLLLQRARVQRLEQQLIEIRTALTEYLPERLVPAAVYMPSAPVLSSLSPWTGGTHCDNGIGSNPSGNKVRPSLRGGGGEDNVYDEEHKYELHRENEREIELPSPTPSSAPNAPNPPMMTARRPGTPFPTNLLDATSDPSILPPTPEGHFPGTLDPVHSAEPIATQTQRDEAVNLWLRRAALQSYHEPCALSTVEEYLSGEKDAEILALLAEAAEAVARRVQEDEDLVVALALQEADNREAMDNEQEVEGMFANIRRQQRSALGKGRKVRRYVAELAAALEQEPKEARAEGVNVETYGSDSDFVLTSGFLGPASLYDADNVSATERQQSGHDAAKLSEGVRSLSLSAANGDGLGDVRQPFKYNEQDRLFRYASSPRRHRIRRTGNRGDMRQVVQDHASAAPKAATLTQRDKAAGHAEMPSNPPSPRVPAETNLVDLQEVVRRQAEQIKQLQIELKTETRFVAPEAQVEKHNENGVASAGGMLKSAIASNHEAAMLLLKKRVNKRLQKLLDKLILKLAVKLIWKAAKKVIN